MKLFNPDKNNIYIGSTDKLTDWSKGEDDQGKAVEKVRLLLKNYLELDNVSFLFGSGSSIHLGAVAIRNFPLEVEEYIKTISTEREDLTYLELIGVVKKLQAKTYAEYEIHADFLSSEYTATNGWTYIVSDDLIRERDSKELVVEFEKVLNLERSLYRKLRKGVSRTSKKLLLWRVFNGTNVQKLLVMTEDDAKLLVTQIGNISEPAKTYLSPKVSNQGSSEAAEKARKLNQRGSNMTEQWLVHMS